MRVTDRMNYGTVNESISRSRGRMDLLQRQNATLKKINAPSDDPIGAAKVMEIRTDKVNNDQFQTNAKLAETFLENTDHALSELSEIVVRAKEIAIGQSSGASSNDQTRLGVAEEIAQLYKQSVATGNRRIGDRYLFGGYKTNNPPVGPEGDYKGDENEIMIEIAKDVYLSTNIPGHVAFNTAPTRGGNESGDSAEQLQEREEGADGINRTPAGTVEPPNVNLFSELQSLRINLLTGNLEGIRGSLDRFDQLHGNLVANRAKVGSRMMGLQNTQQSLERHNVTNAQLNSVLEDADMAQVVSDLAKEETIFRSALSSSQRLIQPTLMDFLK